LSEQTTVFVKAIAARFPSLGSVLDEHIRDNSGEILPHVFFGDLTRHALWLLSALQVDGGITPVGELQDLLTFLEEAYSNGDKEIQELISVSFLENLPTPGEKGSELRSMLGPTLSKQLHAM
jgi:hypothetical protein